MNAHTPGPWTAGTNFYSGERYAVCAGPQVIATVLGMGYPIGKGHAPESDANMALILAAPDLLAACGAAEAAIVAAGMFLPDGDDADRLCATALAELMRASRKAREG